MPLGLLAYLRNSIDPVGGDPMGGGGGGSVEVTPPGGGINPATTPPAAPEKTFTQADLDRIVGETRQKVRAQYEGQMQQIQQQFQPYTEFYNKYGQMVQQFQSPQGGQSPQQDPYSEKWDMLDQMYEEMTNTKVDNMERDLLSKHPEISQTAGLLDQIYQFAADNGYRNLEHAYWAFAGPGMATKFETERKTIGDNAIKEYLKNKGNPPATPEGAGGSPGAQVNVPKTFDEAMKAHRASMKGNPQV